MNRFIASRVDHAPYLDFRVSMINTHLAFIYHTGRDMLIFFYRFCEADTDPLSFISLLQNVFVVIRV